MAIIAKGAIDGGLTHTFHWLAVALVTRFDPGIRGKEQWYTQTDVDCLSSTVSRPLKTSYYKPNSYSCAEAVSTGTKDDSLAPPSCEKLGMAAAQNTVFYFGKARCRFGGYIEGRRLSRLTFQ
jgi:hypothetical protein